MEKSSHDEQDWFAKQILITEESATDLANLLNSTSLVN